MVLCVYMCMCVCVNGYVDPKLLQFMAQGRAMRYVALLCEHVDLGAIVTTEVVQCDPRGWQTTASGPDPACCLFL